MKRSSYYVDLPLLLISLSLLGTTAFAADSGGTGTGTSLGSFPSITNPPAKDSNTWNRGAAPAAMKQCCYVYPVYQAIFTTNYVGDPSGSTFLGCPAGQSLSTIFQYGDTSGTQPKKVYLGICVGTAIKCEQVPTTQTSISYTYISHDPPIYFPPITNSGTAPCP